MSRQYDVIIVGGGLAGTLACLKMAHRRPELRLALLERGSRLGGAHTWSFHESDLSESDLAWVRPLASREWPAYTVRFPRLFRRLSSRYFSIRSEDLDRKAREALGARVRVGCDVVSVGENEVELGNGETLSASLVVDARGWMRPPGIPLAYQKFVGATVTLLRPHGLDVPVVMDATCDQADGYRFFYCLPWNERDVLVEDTHYSDGPEVDVERYRKEIRAYCERNGWTVLSVLHEEVGSLPIPLGGSRPRAAGGAVPIGMRGALFHATTGYSLPVAVETASLLAGLAETTTAKAREAVEAYADALWRSHAFFRFLNRMLFRAAKPELRYLVLERFYRLSEGLIRRFYRGRLAWHDFPRILLGKPPVPIHRAVACLREGVPA